MIVPCVVKTSLGYGHCPELVSVLENTHTCISQAGFIISPIYALQKEHSLADELKLAQKVVQGLTKLQSTLESVSYASMANHAPTC